MFISYSEGAAFGINVDAGTVVRPPNFREDGLIIKRAGNNIVIYNDKYYLDSNEVGELKQRPEWVSIPTLDEGYIKKHPQQPLCKSLEILWIADLATALDRYLPDDTFIDVFLMTNCYMHLFDTGYALRKRVKYLVASEGFLSFWGYDFNKLFGYLKTPSTDIETLTQQMMQDLLDMYIDMSDGDDFNKSSVYANRLWHYEEALDVFNSMVTGLIQVLPQPGVMDQLIGIRGQCLSVADDPNYSLIDAGRWLRLVTSQVTTLPDGSYYHGKFTALQGAIVSAKRLGGLYEAVPPTDPQQYGYSGISIYYPQTAITPGSIGWCAYFDQQIPEPFRTDTKWDEFLAAYYARLSKNQAAHFNGPP
jgi:hypothetical protein